MRNTTVLAHQDQHGRAQMPTPRLRRYDGPAILSYGFRPFFLLGSIYSGLAILVWLPVFRGELELASALAPRDWHVHEMLYGYLPAVITGFLLTAVPNWTGRLPLQGRPLLVLVLIWLAGRIAVTMSAWTGWAAAAVVDLAFPSRRRNGGGARDRRGTQLAEPQGADRPRRSVCRQHHLPCRGPRERLRGRRGTRGDRRVGCPDHGHRRSHHSELHAKLARQREPGTPSGLLRSVRRCVGRACGHCVDRLVSGARIGSDRNRPDTSRSTASGAACPMGGRADLAGADRARPPRRLCLRAARVRPRRSRLLRLVAGERRHPRMDRRSVRGDDARRDVPGEPRSHGTHARRQQGCPDGLCTRPHRDGGS